MKIGSRGDPEGYRIYRTGQARRRRIRLVVLSVVGALVIAAIAVAGGSYWWFSAKVGAANERIEEGVEKALAESPSTTIMPMDQFQQSKKAVNMILLGSDTRGDTVDSSGRSDTIMLVHVDPELDFASILSIPRDLWVDIPGHSQNRINAAYAFGGPQLTIKTVKNLFGLNITKYTEIGFEAFQEIVDSLGGVYVDVDRRYSDEQPRPIDLQAGYQLLDGPSALLFARYRFDQNSDWGRQIRQQRVIAAIREQAMGWNLPMKLPGLVGTTLDAVATNLSTNEMLELAYFIVKLDGDRIRQIQVKASGKTIEGRSVVVADQASLKDALTQLLTPPGADAEQASSTSTSSKPATASTLEMLASATATPGFSSVATVAETSNTTSTRASATGSGGLADRDMWRAAQRSVPFTLEAPGFIPSGLTYAYKTPGDGTYQIDPGGKSKPAVRMLYRYKGGDQYLGITATTWLDAPVASKGSEVEANGVKYTVVGTSGKVHHIWWKKDGVLYFISNTLMYAINKENLLKMATSMAPVEGSN